MYKLEFYKDNFRNYGFATKLIVVLFLLFCPFLLFEVKPKVSNT